MLLCEPYLFTMDKINNFYVDFNKAWKDYQKENDLKEDKFSTNFYLGGENSYCLTLSAYIDHTYEVTKQNIRNYRRNYYIKRYGYPWN